MKNKLEIVIILSHLMNKDGLLDLESIKRIEKEFKFLKEESAPF